MKKVLLSVFLFLLAVAGFSQPICGFDDILEKQLADKETAAKLRLTEEQIRHFIANNAPVLNNLGTALYIIPVVVHVVHTGEAVGTLYNPSEAQILSAINYLNQAYDGTAPGFFGGAGDIQVQFKLAQRDPNCNPTNGIDRVDGRILSGYAEYGVRRNTANGITDGQLKSQSSWDPSRYYNVWTVNKIDANDGTSGQFIAGYATLATTNTNASDGTVMLATQMKQGAKTLPHEVGHALGLYHPFQGSSGNTVCPANTSCNSQGDFVCDTDPITYNASGGVVNFSCRSGINPCTGTAYGIYTENNVMNYTSCFTLFTPGQKERMLAVMNLPSRLSLANSTADEPTDGMIAPCPPKINFELAAITITEATSGSADCRGYKDYVYNMTIGNVPSANTIVTLTTSGTATPGADFVVSTNDNFMSPSATLLFAAGSKLGQQFKVRIFDDAAIEPDETIVIDFTVDAGVGNALKGDGIPSTSIVIKSNDNTDPGPLTGQNVESTINYNRTAYLGPNDDVVFYSIANNVMLRIKNLTAFDYGCTQVKIDGAGSGAKPFTSNNTAEFIADKTLEIIPTNDNINGAFQVTLYYKSAEVSGWKAVTGKNLSAANMLKAANAISSYTPGTVSVNTLKVAAPTFQPFGIDSLLTGQFNTSLRGGYAIGAITVPLTFVYTFTGNGLWTEPTNWAGLSVPPSILPAGAQIIIDPAPGGQCILNTAQTVQSGGSIQVNPNKHLVIQGALQVNNQ